MWTIRLTQRQTHNCDPAGKRLLKAAEQNEPHAETNLGDMYARGLGVRQDLEEAKRWYRKAAEQGHERACTALEELNHDRADLTSEHL
jgi:TPR repeat protein